ncbi:MAG: hypothetical protein QOC60_575 [Frankiaceae bacterium]|nr:hypothetical protein [Frankiaceae bacterium]
MTKLEWSGLSNHLFQWTLLAYFLAMIGFALEYAYGTRGAVATAATPATAARPATVEAQARQPVLVGAWSGIGESVVPPVEPPAAPERRWPVHLGIAAVGATVVGWLLHIGAVLTRAFAAGHVPWGNMYEFSLAVSLVAVTVYLALLITKQVRYLGLWVMMPVTIYLLVAGMALYSAAGPLVPILSKSYWLLVHVTAILTATGALMVAGVVAVMHLVRRRYEALDAAGKAPTRGFVSMAVRLAPAKTLDRVEYKLVAFAFPIYTFAVIAGAVWAESAWGRYWGWDPKETWSFVTWLVYAAYLHARTTAGWRKQASTISLVAFGCLMANYFLINLVFVGKHSYGGVTKAAISVSTCQSSSAGDGCRTMRV